MCFCCCQTRFSLITYLIILSAIAFLYGIVTISNSGSNNKVYKVLVDRIKNLEKCKESCSVGSVNYYLSMRDIDNAYQTGDYQNLFDQATLSGISGMDYSFIKDKKTNLIKGLKGIDLGFGIVILIFIFCYIGAGILFWIYLRGVKEYQVLPAKTYTIFNIIRLVCIYSSLLLIAMSVLYVILLIATFAQYAKLLNVLNSITTGLILGIVFGIYCFFYFITTACGFYTERNKFVLVGSDEKPGPDAKYDINQNPIFRQVNPPTSLDNNKGQPLPQNSYSQNKIPQQQGVSINNLNSNDRLGVK